MPIIIENHGALIKIFYKSAIYRIHCRILSAVRVPDGILPPMWRVQGLGKGDFFVIMAADGLVLCRETQ